MDIDVYNKVKKKFSKSAQHYEELSGLQQTIGLKILKTIDEQLKPSHILDIGMGTGWLTEKIAEKFPQAQITGIDFAYGMVDFAKKKSTLKNIIQADACALSFKENIFDCVISNLTYQWVANLNKALKDAYRTLKKNGHFYFNSFGSGTLSELFFSLEKLITKEKKEDNEINALSSKEEITDAVVQAGFSDFHISTEGYKVYFHDVPSLLWWLKNIGANTVRHGVYFGKDLFFQTSDFYQKNFSERGKIYASFEVVWVKARK